MKKMRSFFQTVLTVVVVLFFVLFGSLFWPSEETGNMVETPREGE